MYGNGRQFDRGVMRTKRAGLLVTTGGDGAFFTPDIAGQLSDILFPIQRNILEFVGYECLSTIAVHAPARMTVAAREAALRQSADRLVDLCA